MNRRFAGLGASLAILVLAACGSSSTASDNTSPSPAQASSSPSAAASAVATTTDPCQVVTQGEASQLTSTSFGPGKEETTSNGSGKLCWYGAQTTDVFEVFIATASSAATAQAQWDTEKAQVQSELTKATAAPGVTFSVNINDTSIAGADRAASGTLTASYNGHTISGSVLYMLKGAVFCAIVDIRVDGQAPPSISALEAQGQTSLGRLP
jgi:hypothetical protein